MPYDKEWRSKHPDAYAKQQMRKHIRRQNQTLEAAVNYRKEWTFSELEQITADDRPTDVELALQLGRTYYSIRRMRKKSLKGKVEME